MLGKSAGGIPGENKIGMTSYPIQQMKETEKLVLTNSQLFWHYSIILFFFIPPLMNIVDVYKYFVNNTYTGVRPLAEMATWSYLPLIPAILFYFIQKRRLKFKTIPLKINTEIFTTAGKETAKQLDWKILAQTSNLIVAKSGFSWRSWGELITIIKDKDRILFNSICDPDNRPSITSWGMNKLNLKTFEEQVRLSMSNASA